MTAWLVWALAGASAVFWGLRVIVAGSQPPAHAVAAPAFLQARADLGRLLGAGAGPVAASAAGAAAPAPGFDVSTLTLWGIVQSDAGPAGVAGPSFALIAVQGRPARAYGVGTEVVAGQVVQRLDARSVDLGPPDGAVAATLALPDQAPPSRALPAPAGAPVPGRSALAPAAGPVRPDAQAQRRPRVSER